MMDDLEPTLLKRMFRVDRAAFVYILSKIEPYLSMNNAKACNSSGDGTSPRTRLAVTL
jgi:hypothetical protein